MPRLLHSSRLFLGVTLAAALCLAAPPLARAAPEEAPSGSPAAFASEAVKAAYITHFITFTDWPADSLPEDAPYVIGISGNRALEDELLRLADSKFIRGHRLRIVRLRNTRDLDGVHLAFFDSSTQAQLEALPVREALTLLRQRPVLTVSDSPAFLSLGGIINFYREKSALRFEIAPDAAREAGLVISSRLLALARIHPSGAAPAAPAP